MLRLTYVLGKSKESDLCHAYLCTLAQPSSNASLSSWFFGISIPASILMVRALTSLRRPSHLLVRSLALFLLALSSSIWAFQADLKLRNEAFAKSNNVSLFQRTDGLLRRSGIASSSCLHAVSCRSYKTTK